MDASEIDLLVRQGEGLTVEFKQSFTPRIDEDLVAFSNTRGGHVLLGVADDKSVPGFEMTNDIRGRITSLARNCKPSIEVAISQAGSVGIVSVPEGEGKPYSCGAGYFRRLDGASQKMNHDELRMMFTQSDAVPYEKKTGTGATLSSISRAKLSRFLREARIDAKASRAISLLTSFSMLEGEKVNNAGVMFFAKEPRMLISQCQSSMIAFKDAEGTIIYDRLDVKDDLLEQFMQAMFFIKKHLNVSSTIKGVRRVDEYELPLEALREAVANAIVHRDYSARGTDLAIRIFPDRVEIANPAKLPFGAKPSDFEGVSIRHNEIIADMLYRLDVVERAGTGIMKMQRLMRDAGLPAPKISLGLFYRITFLKPKKKILAKGLEKNTPQATPQATPQVHLSSLERKIFNVVQTEPGISRAALSAKLKISADTVKEYLEKLKAKGAIRRVGMTSAGHWETTARAAGAKVGKKAKKSR